MQILRLTYFSQSFHAHRTGFQLVIMNGSCIVEPVKFIQTNLHWKQGVISSSKRSKRGLLIPSSKLYQR